MAGNRITSRIEGCPVISMTRRSTPMPSPPVGGMPYSSARTIVGVEGLCLVVARGALASLVLEARPLLVGVVELAERVGHFPAVDEQLEPFGQRRIGTGASAPAGTAPWDSPPRRSAAPDAAPESP